MMKGEFTISWSSNSLKRLARFLSAKLLPIIIGCLTFLSVSHFLTYYGNGLGLSYNDARSHLDIGRRVVEGLKPGLAQIGSVWLPLPHLLMVPTIWNDFMWHSGLSGALESMVAFIFTGLLIYFYLEKLQVAIPGRLVGVAVFASNLNVLYLQSTAMTELLLLATLTGAAYYLLLWMRSDGELLSFIKASFFVMLSTLVRYEGWFLLLFTSVLVILFMWKKSGRVAAEGSMVMFATLAGVGIGLWFLWNLLIFKDPLYFIFGPYSARAQQSQLEQAGVLTTKGNPGLSLKVYLLAVVYNSGVYPMVVAFIGLLVLWIDRTVKNWVKLATTILIVPFLFNVLALYFGHSVLFIEGLSGTTWFNVRYGILMIPAIAIFIGVAFDRFKAYRLPLVGLLLFVSIFAVINRDAVTIDDARVGSSQKNVSEVSTWLHNHAENQSGFVLISAASHDAIIFSSGLAMKRFIHEGTGAYWKSATTSPERWARWIIMRTYDDADQTYRAVKAAPGFSRYTKVAQYPFADIYELQPSYLPELITEPVLGKQK